MSSYTSDRSPRAIVDPPSEEGGQLITQNRREVVLSRINELSERKRNQRKEIKQEKKREKMGEKLVRSTQKAPVSFFKFCEQSFRFNEDEVRSFLRGDDAEEFMRIVAERAKRDMRGMKTLVALFWWFPILGWLALMMSLPSSDEKISYGWDYLFHRRRLEKYGRAGELDRALKRGW